MHEPRMFSPDPASLHSNLAGCAAPGVLGLLMVAVGLFVPYGASVARWLMVIGGAGGIAVSLYLLRATIKVHRISLGVSDQGLHLACGRQRLEIPWEKIDFGQLYIRENRVSRTDKMLVIHVDGRRLSYHPSVLSEEDEREFLTLVRTHLPLEEVYHTPAL